jgi:Na+-transporting methylmalonyl-CoA/oxaloacetate decarboxylase gamma subunit
MSKNLNIDIKSLRAKFKKLLPVLYKHASFIIVLAVLIVYLFVVWRISQLAGAEPPAGTDALTTSAAPKVDKNAIDQIQALEQSNTEIHSLFDSARKNPFSE